MKKLLLLVVFFGLSSSGFSQWSTDPNVNNRVTSKTGDQDNVASCPDGAGGIIMCWVDESTHKIYAQKINAFGQAQWAAGGINISGNTGYHTNPCICSDAGGGAIIGWWDDRVGVYDVFSQRVRTDGILMWQAGGIRVTSTSYSGLWEVKCTGAEAGYAIFGWRDLFDGVYTQKLSADGSRLWNSNDLRISTFLTYAFDMCKDGKNGIYFTYSMRDTTADNWSVDIFAQHVTSAGDTTWNVHHCIEHDTLTQFRPSMCEDQDYGFIVAWDDQRSGPYTDIYAQRVDSQGVNQWGPHGKAISTNPYTQFRAVCVSDGHSGANIVWTDFGAPGVSGDNLFGQNVTHNGVSRWTNNGKRIASIVDGTQTADDRYLPQIASVDALGGLIVCWIGYYDNTLSQYGLLAQRIDYNGNLMWNGNGVFVSTGNLKKGPTMISDGGMSGCNIAWVEGRNYGASGYDIYAQHVKSNATLGNRPNSNDPSSISKTATVKQNYPNPFNPVTNISFDISQSGFVSLKIFDMTGREVAVLANGVYNPGQYSVTWDASNFATGAYLYKFITNEKTEIKTMMLIK